MPTQGRPDDHDEYYPSNEDSSFVKYSVVRESSKIVKDFNTFKILNEISFEEMRTNRTGHNVTLEQPRTPPIAHEVKFYFI